MLKPPQAKKIPQAYDLHEDKRIDDYAWLRNIKTDPDVKAYLEAENAFTEHHMKPTEKLQEALFTEMRNRIQLADTTVPYFEENYYYYWKTLETSEYAIFCRRHETMSAEEEIILDENALAKDKPFFHLGDCATSFDQQFLAYTQDITGNEAYTLHIKNLQTQKTIDTGIDHLSSSVVWANDNNTVFYVKLDKTLRPYQVYCYDMRTKNTRLLYTEQNEAFAIDIEQSKNKAYILLNIASKNTTEVHAFPADNPQAEFTCIYPRKNEIKYEVYPFYDSWFIRTNDHAKNFRVIKTKMSNLDPTHWEIVQPHHPEIKIEDVEVFNDYLVLVERQEARLQLRVLNFNTKENKLLSFPEGAYSVEPVDNIDVNQSIIRVEYTSLTTPRTIYDIDLRTYEHTLLKQTHVLGDFDINNYHSERIYVRASDGTKIPVSILYHRNTPRDGSAPLYLYGYGSYGISLDPWFSSARLSLVNRGIIYAIAHVRGGGDNGEYWYEAGKLLQKKHTFLDFINCADYLIEHHYTCKEKLIICGGSAGGLLMGAVLNERPDLFSMAVAHVPFVDVLNTMLDPSIPLTTGEYEEWGNPAQPEFYYYIKSYSPYDNVKHQPYPALLITTGLSDPRVQYWEPAKWIAKLREHNTSNNILLLRTNMKAGHQGPSGRFGALKEVAFEYAFILQQLGKT